MWRSALCFVGQKAPELLSKGAAFPGSGVDGSLVYRVSRHLKTHVALCSMFFRGPEGPRAALQRGSLPRQRRGWQPCLPGELTRLERRGCHSAPLAAPSVRHARSQQTRSAPRNLQAVAFPSKHVCPSGPDTRSVPCRPCRPHSALRSARWAQPPCPWCPQRPTAWAASRTRPARPSRARRCSSSAAPAALPSRRVLAGRGRSRLMGLTSAAWVSMEIRSCACGHGISLR